MRSILNIYTYSLSGWFHNFKEILNNCRHHTHSRRRYRSIRRYPDNRKYRYWLFPQHTDYR